MSPGEHQHSSPYESSTKTNSSSHQQKYAYTTPELQTSSPSFADVTSHGISCFHSLKCNSHSTSSSPSDYAQCLRAASPAAKTNPAAALPPPIAPWALGPAGCFRDCAGACAVCGAASGGAVCGGTACGGAAGFDDPFRADWPHW
jgi:hypothetical protein